MKKSNRWFAAMAALVFGITSFSYFFFAQTVHADPLQELQKKQEQLKKEELRIKKRIEGLDSKSDAQKQLLANLEEQVDALETEISEKEKKIKSLEQETKALEKKKNDDIEKYGKYLREMYMTQEQTFLDSLLNSRSFSEYLVIEDAYSRIFDSNADAVQKMVDSIYKATENKKEIEHSKKELENKRPELKSRNEEMEQLILNLQSLKNKSKQELDEIQKNRDKANREIKDIISSLPIVDDTPEQTPKPEVTAPKPEQSKPETTPEQSKPESPKPEETPEEEKTGEKPESSTPEASTPETPKPQTPKPEASKPNTSKPQTSKPKPKPETWGTPLRHKDPFISCLYGDDYIPGSGYRFHWGVDFTGSKFTGTPILASKSGTVVRAKYSSDYGNHVIIQHEKADGKVYYSLYAHMSKLHVKEGQKVKKGKQIGAGGNTGYSFGAHLHFEIFTRTNGGKAVNIDPMKYLPKMRIDLV